jgi:hypothetical protein
MKYLVRTETADTGKALDTLVFDRNDCRVTAVLPNLIDTLCRAVFMPLLPAFILAFRDPANPTIFLFFTPLRPALSRLNGLHFSIPKRPAYTTFPAAHLRLSSQTQNRRLLSTTRTSFFSLNHTRLYSAFSASSETNSLYPPQTQVHSRIEISIRQKISSQA